MSGPKGGYLESDLLWQIYYTIVHYQRSRLRLSHAIARGEEKTCIQGRQVMHVAFTLNIQGVIKAMPKREPTLEESQKIVGGYIQVIDIRFLNEPGQMVMNENGKHEDLGSTSRQPR